MKSTKSKVKISNPIPLLAIVVLGLVFLSSTCNKSDKQIDSFVESDTQNSLPITVSSDVPADIFTDDTPASEANLAQAANFAWNEFIALNWPASSNRDVPNTALKFGSQGGATPLVWHTYRHKVETYPGNGTPPGYDATAPDYGYNTSSPTYIYKDGEISPCDVASSTTPWINLDENNEIGVTTMYAGVSDTVKYPDPQILFLAKCNEEEYKYIAKNQWWGGGSSFDEAKDSTIAYIDNNNMTPPYDSTSSKYVSFPPGTIEVKTAWRRLSTTEIESKRFYSTTVRYYDNEADPCYIDDEFGMLALHIIHKTPTAPYFIYATFEQADNILTTDGHPVEDVDGNIIANQDSMPTTPALTVTNATSTTSEMFSPTTANSTPGNSLYYINTSGNAAPQGTVTYNRRYNSIPDTIISANENAHSLIKSYNTTNGITNSPWEYYKLVNVQYVPIDKEPGVDYTGDRMSEYYLSNSVVESDYVLQMFSGALSPDLTSTDYNGSNTAYNAYNDKAYLMGGCMGCHGNATNTGRDYSFIIGKRAKEPEVASTVSLTDTKVKEFIRLMK